MGGQPRCWHRLTYVKGHLLLPPGEDIRRLEAGVQIVSGTPGRVFDMIKRRVLQTRDIKVLVLDEADEMLAKGFREQIYDVYRCPRRAGPAGTCTSRPFQRHSRTGR